MNAYYTEQMANRRDALKLAGLAPALLFAAGGKKLPNVTLSTSDVKVATEPFGEVRIYFDGPTDVVGWMTAGSVRLNPGASPHPPHQHDEEEFLLITEGTGEISIDEKLSQVGPGSMMYCEANRLHGIVNTGSTSLLFYFYKWK